MDAGAGRYPLVPGRIVWAEIADPQRRNPKSRRCVLVTDKLLIGSSLYSPERIVTVDRVTATLVICGKAKFRIKDGYKHGSTGYIKDHASLATAEDVERYKARKVLSTIRDMVMRADAKWPLSTLEEVLEILQHDEC